jgi:hypothetical protein
MKECIDAQNIGQGFVSARFQKFDFVELHGVNVTMLLAAFRLDEGESKMTTAASSASTSLSRCHLD